MPGFVNLNQQNLDAFASRNHGGQFFVCPYRYLGAYLGTDTQSILWPLTVLACVCFFHAWTSLLVKGAPK
ncbi:hypothetical protein P9112_007582 [Eukaryota sp. TZLM1-RC]